MDSEGRLLTRHSGAVTSVAFGRVDGRPVALSGSNDKTVQVWDLTDMRPLTEPFTGHTSVVTSVAFAEAGGRPLLLSGGNDNTLRVCDLKKSV
jgi:WD40 repeat protein